jgi:hypothetical protein
MNAKVVVLSNNKKGGWFYKDKDENEDEDNS